MAAGPRSTPELVPERAKAVISDDDAAELRAALDEAERGEGVELTPEQLKHWAETGELPWLESPSSPPGS